MSLTQAKEAANLRIDAVLDREVRLWLMLHIFVYKYGALVSDLAHSQLGDFCDPPKILHGLELSSESILNLKDHFADWLSNHHTFRQPVREHD